MCIIIYYELLNYKMLATIDKTGHRYTPNNDVFFYLGVLGIYCFQL